MSADPASLVHECRCSVCRTTPDDPTAYQHSQMNLFLSRLSEPQRRWYVGLLSAAPDGATDELLALMTGLSVPTIRRGRTELAAGLADAPPLRARRSGAGRPPAEKKTPG